MLPYSARCTLAAFTLLTVACTNEEPQEEIGQALGTLCKRRPECDAPLPKLEASGFRHFGSALVAHAGDPAHRVRDQLLREGEPQWLIGRFAYGILDKGLEHEPVEIYVQRSCDGPLDLVATIETTDDGEHVSEDGVTDNGGRVFFQIPKNEELPIGRHRFVMSVKGDRSYAEGIVEVVGKDAKFFVSDVDGTLTTSENAELPAFVKGEVPEANPDAAELFQRLADKGYLPIYLSARRAQIEERTLAFLRERGFPRGVVRVSESKLGLYGAEARTYKLNELDKVKAHGTIAWGFGNRASDAEAYEAIGIAPSAHRVFLRLSDLHGGRSVQGYGELLTEAESLPHVACK